MAAATQPSLDFLSRLLKERSYPQQWRDDLEKQAQRNSSGVLTQAAASRAIDFLKAQPMKDGRPGPPPSPAQADLLGRLLAEKEIPDELAEFAALLGEATRRDIMTRDVAHDAITKLIGLPDKPQAARDEKGELPEVPDGRYALGTVEDHTLYSVRNGRTRTFVDRIEANEHTVGVRGDKAREVLEHIAADPRAAAILYGEVTDRCFRCDKFLTHKKSRISKVGKKCAGYIGVTWGEPPGGTTQPEPEPAAPTAPASTGEEQPALFAGLF